MGWQHTPYTIPFFISSISTALLALFIWQYRRKTPESKTLTILMVAVAIWALGDGLELGGANLSTRIFWTKVRYFGIVTIPAAWLCLSIQYGRLGKWLKRRNILLLAIEPIVMLLLVWTNDVHHLIWRSWRIETVGSVEALFSDHGIGWLINMMYSYLLLLAGSVLIIRVIIRSRNLFRGQAVAMLTAALAP